MRLGDESIYEPQSNKWKKKIYHPPQALHSFDFALDRQGRGNAKDIPSGKENKTYEENKPDEEISSPLAGEGLG